MKKFEELQYGDIIQWKMFPLYTLLIVSFTVGTDEPIFQDVVLENTGKMMFLFNLLIKLF